MRLRETDEDIHATKEKLWGSLAIEQRSQHACWDARNSNLSEVNRGRARWNAAKQLQKHGVSPEKTENTHKHTTKTHDVTFRCSMDPRLERAKSCRKKVMERLMFLLGSNTQTESSKLHPFGASYQFLGEEWRLKKMLRLQRKDERRKLSKIGLCTSRHSRGHTAKGRHPKNHHDA